ncbi:MAG: beta-N-acetylhexosaminidase [Prevotellaceae bacterium]|nr:beta-N-acetylhexosaminidase [Prevotellaceae bacterium]
MNIKLLALSLLVPASLCAEELNLTPRPKSIAVGDGSLPLTSGFTVGYGSLPDSLSQEAEKFVSSINDATALGAEAASTDDGLVRMTLDETLADEGYSLTIDEGGVSLKARTSAGFFYAFQTLKKILPANVMAGVLDAEATYSLPYLTIDDEPRFPYRGFMLDVSRHFFTVEEVERMIDLMAAYKMNRFHWHLTDDQGWRAEIKQYPLLTTTGATASNCRVTDLTYGSYWTNEQYGPYFYTQEEMREVVEYCQERHIEVIPEVDMPGHFVAAMASYPEYSCRPNNPPTVWTTGGISSDVLNVGNPEAVQFVKNILDELCDIFPSPLFHIGGDECPTTYWESNSQCQELYNELGLSSYRALQSHFINEISEYLAQKGKRAVLWNESISASGADIDAVKEYNPVIMCWSPCQSSASTAAGLGLDNIVTEYHSSSNGVGQSYYINRVASSADEGAGSGDDTVEGTYEYVPVPASTSEDLLPYYTGVQATFWCEWVALNDYLEYLALPKLMAVAEAGWTPQDLKDFSSFVDRMAQDTVMLNLGGYTYAKHIFLSSEDMVKPKADEWYTLETLATDGRSGRCIELLSASSPLVSTYSGNGAAEGKLWENEMAEEGDDNFDYQLWQFQEDEETGLYAMVSKAAPEGSVDPTPSAQSNAGRWTYDTTAKHYGFVLGDGAYGTSDGHYYYSIRPNAISGWYMNASMAVQGYAINVWSSATDGYSGEWLFLPLNPDEAEEEDTFSQDLYDQLPKLAEGDTIYIYCAVAGFEDEFLADKTGNTYVTWTGTQDETTKWVAYKVTEMDSAYSQTAVLRNWSSKRYIYKPETSSVGDIAYPLNASAGYSSAPAVTFAYQPETQDYALFVGGLNLYPVPLGSDTWPGIVSCGCTINRAGLAVRPQGAAWQWQLWESEDESETDAIAAVPSSSPNALSGWYNLSGQRIGQPDKAGIYIVNGKKQVIQ